MPFLGWLDSKAAGAPRWLTKGWGGDFLRAVGVTFDATVETARVGVKMRFPSYSPPDGLVALGEERQCVRATAYLYEDDFAFAARVKRIWDDAPTMGTKPGLVAIFAVFGFTGYSVYDKGEWFPSKKKHAWVFLPKSQHPWGPGPAVGDGTKVGSGATVGSSLLSSQVKNIRRVTAPWVPPNVRGYLHLQTEEGPIVGDGSDVGDGSVVGGKSCKLRLGKGTIQ
jgi:hypothetical protein